MRQIPNFLYRFIEDDCLIDDSDFDFDQVVFDNLVNNWHTPRKEINDQIRYYINLGVEDPVNEAFRLVMSNNLWSLRKSIISDTPIVDGVRNKNYIAIQLDNGSEVNIGLDYSPEQVKSVYDQEQFNENNPNN